MTPAENKTGDRAAVVIAVVVLSPVAALIVGFAIRCFLFGLGVR